MPSAETLFDVSWPILSTLFGVVVGALIGVYISNNSIKTERRGRSRKIAGALTQSLQMNLTLVASNAADLETDLQALANGKEFVAPLRRLQNGLMGLLLVEVPGQLLSDDALEQFRAVAMGVDYYNECIEGRAMYHANSGAMSNRGSNLRVRDEHILSVGKAVEPQLNAVIALLEANPAA